MKHEKKFGKANYKNQVSIFKKSDFSFIFQLWIFLQNEFLF